MARRFFPGENPIGQRVMIFNGLDPNWVGDIIGVVANYRGSWKHDAGKQIYTAAQQATRVESITFDVRTARDRALNKQRVRALVRLEAPMLSTFDIETMNFRMAEFASSERAMMLLSSAFAAIALIISLIGVYGVVAYSSTLRTAEFGVRFAVAQDDRTFSG